MTNLDEKKLDDLIHLFKEFDCDRNEEFIKRFPEIWHDCYDIEEDSRYHRGMIGCVSAGYKQAFADQQKKIEKLEKERDAYATSMKIALEDGIFSHKETTRQKILKTLAEVDAILKEGK